VCPAVSVFLVVVGLVVAIAFVSDEPDTLAILVPIAVVLRSGDVGHSWRHMCPAKKELGMALVGAIAACVPLSLFGRGCLDTDSSLKRPVQAGNDIDIGCMVSPSARPLSSVETHLSRHPFSPQMVTWKQLDGQFPSLLGLYQQSGQPRLLDDILGNAAQTSLPKPLHP